MSTPAEPAPPRPVSHRERLWVPVSWVLVTAACVLSVVLICFFYMPLPMVLMISGLAVAAAVGLLLDQSALLVVDDQGLRAGRARLGWAWVAGARVLTAAETESSTRGRRDVRAFRLTRPYLPHQVRVELADPADPHPAWLLGSRHPQELTAAIRNQLARAQQVSP